MAKNLPTNAGDTGLIPGLGRFPAEGNGNPLQYFAWEIPWTEEHGGVAKELDNLITNQQPKQTL